MRKKKLALFDLDNTLLTGDSNDEWFNFLAAEGALDKEAGQAAKENIVHRYREGSVGTLEFCEYFLQLYVPHEMPTLIIWREKYVREWIIPRIPDSARELLDSHRDGLVVIATATNRFITEPIAQELGVEHLIATEPEMRNGRFTGRVAGTPSLREGKVTRVLEWLATRGQALEGFEESWFYSDSINDRPLLERVSHPVVVDPDARLRSLANMRNWEIISLRKTLPV
ncbi:MAG: HAD family hydrolase [Betaproteobacteria bacterium]|nr:HAD family hydrolase [Betaproteobacteria bacterium]MSQ89363.1 HAD family hydrolase [Betaproteobacteria bacterium]